MYFNRIHSAARVAAVLTLALTLAACGMLQQGTRWNPMDRQTTEAGNGEANVAPPRVSGPVTPDAAEADLKPRVLSGDRLHPGDSAGMQPVVEGGDITLNFTDTDIREVARIILGDLLKTTYTIDPAVKGTATIYTPTPVSRDMLPQILTSLLAQNNAQLIRRDGIYNVLPMASSAPALQGLGGGANLAETTEVVQLRYVSATQLAKVLAPFMTPSSRVVAGPANNTLLVSGSATARSSLLALIRTFDTDVLAGQSYAIFPVSEADPEKVALEVKGFVQSAMNEANGPIYVMALERINAVLAVAQEPAYLDRIGRFIHQVDAVGDTTARRLHVYYVQNGTAPDLASLLQKAFAPRKDAMDTASEPGSLAPNTDAAMVSNTSPDAPAPATQGLSGGLSGSQGASGMTGGATSGASSRNFAASLSNNTLSSTRGNLQEPETPASSKGMRFIPDSKNNALLIFATPAEYKLIDATLRKVDILPLQVLVEATVAEVTLNDNLQYGTQFFLKTGAFSSILSNAANGAINPEFPGFAFAFASSSAQVALSALKSVTTVKVVSDPQLLVLNNESARLQVGDLVPIVTQSAVSTQTSGAPIVNTVDYKETGVIIQVTPRVNSGGLVTLDIQQEVSDVVKTSTSTIDSPTIQQRKIKTRIVAQDGETIGLGGLIKDSNTVSNAGVPWLTDIPVLGALFGSRGHLSGRTELLILLTPRVIRDQRTVRALTDDLRTKLGSLSGMPIVRDPIEPPGPLRR